MLKIRQADISDFEKIKELWIKTSLFDEKMTAKDIVEKKLERDPDLFLVLEIDNKLIGVVLGGFDGRFGNITHLAIDPEHQGKGYGKLLMAKIEDMLKRKGAISCFVLALKTKFFEKLGYRDSGRSKFLWKPL